MAILAPGALSCGRANPPAPVCTMGVPTPRAPPLPTSFQPLPSGCHRNRPTRSRTSSWCPPPPLPPPPGQPRLGIGPSGNAAGRLSPVCGARQAGGRGLPMPPLTAPEPLARPLRSDTHAPPAPTTQRARPGAAQAEPASGARHKGKRGPRGSQPAPHPAAPSSARLPTWVLSRDAPLLPGTPGQRGTQSRRG